MSTKIYNAYRINKNKDIKDIIKKMREIAIYNMSNNKDYFYLAHAISSAMAFKENQNELAKEVCKEIEKNEFGILSEMWMIDKIKNSKAKDILDCGLMAVATFDDEYWYLKFFSGSKFMDKILNTIEIEIKELEDYHYQNQSDPPEDIEYEEYLKRGKKWNELIPDYTPFNSLPFEIIIFDISRLERLLTEYKNGNIQLSYNFVKTPQ